RDAREVHGIREGPSRRDIFRLDLEVAGGRADVPVQSAAAAVQDRDVALAAVARPPSMDSANRAEVAVFFMTISLFFVRNELWWLAPQFQTVR
ncbi:MAG TPA: hypothetical protein VJ233_16910, partial [Hyphomicrobiaceae bacterium]|nr:hypothetical protein [Hyphomicrobiaceae bacterium]